MLKENLERKLSKGTRSQEGTRSSVDRYRWNEIVHSINDQGALKLKPEIDVEIERLSPECKDKIKTVLQTREAKPTEICPFVDMSLGIRRIHLGKGPLRIEVTGDQFDKIPRVLTTTILEAVYGWRFEGIDDVGYVPTDNGPKRIKNYGLFYEGKEIVAVMYGLPLDSDCKNILVRRLKCDGNRRDKQILVRYRPAGRSDGGNRLGYRYFIDYTMFSPARVKQRAIEILAPLERSFNEKYEPTLAQTKKELMRHIVDEIS
jgi:hypothetical protein